MNTTARWAITWEDSMGGDGGPEEAYANNWQEAIDDWLWDSGSIDESTLYEVLSQQEIASGGTVDIYYKKYDLRISVTAIAA